MYAVIGTLGVSVICFIMYYIMNVLHKILTPMKNGRPFEEGISTYLKNIGWAILVGGSITEILGVVSRVLLVNSYPMNAIFTSEAITKMEFMFTINLNFVLLAIVMYLLSYIFQYGQQLQQESDETL